MSSREDDRISYLTGEERSALTDRERAELDEVRAVLADPATWAVPAPELEDRVVAAIADEAHTRPDRVAEEAHALPERERSRRRAPAWRRWSPHRGFAFGGLAAAAATAIVAVVLVSSGGTPAPERFAMALAGTPLAPTAHGSATLTKTGSGWRIQLSATGLPHIAGGRYYQAWLKNRAGVLVPVGTFNDARSVTLWAGVPPPQFPSLTVTMQRANGDPASSGLRVLTGTIRPLH
jgi:hypothetical protein